VANYQAHKSTGLGWWVFVSLSLYLFKGNVGLNDHHFLVAVVVGLPATLMGAGFPDIDLAASIPHRRLRLTLFLLITVPGFWLLMQPPGQRVLAAALQEASWPARLAPLGALVLALLLGSLAVALLAFFLPPHRGVTHGWPLGITVALTVAGLLGVSLSMMAVAPRTLWVAALSAGGFFLVGFASHLYRDKLVFKKKVRKR
jgi:hypothetical protein